LRYQLLILTILLFFLTISCEEDIVDNSNHYNNQYSDKKISFVIPTHGYPGDTFWIYGENLKDTTFCKVFLGEFECPTNIESDSILSAVVPVIDSGFYNIKVSFSDTVIKFNNKFQVFYGEKKYPKIDSISPLSGKPGITMFIYGKDFGEILSNVKIYFDNTLVKILSFNDSVISVEVPELNTGYYDIKLIAYNTGINFSDGFCIINSPYDFNKVFIHPKRMIQVTLKCHTRRF